MPILHVRRRAPDLAGLPGGTGARRPVQRGPVRPAEELDAKAARVRGGDPGLVRLPRLFWLDVLLLHYRTWQEEFR